MPAQFKRVFRVQGMDTAATPIFQMVPRSGSRWVALHDGAGLGVISLNPAVCTITEIRETSLPADDRASGGGAAVHGDRFFRLDGGAAGSALIVAGSLTALPALLDVRVKDKFTQTVKFYSVRDNAHHVSTRPLADVGAFLPVLNYIFKRQANIEFSRHGSLETLTVPSALGNPIQLNPAGGLGADATTIVNLGARGSDLNVFFVWELRRAAAGDSTEATTQTIGSAHVSGGPGNILMEDDIDGRDDLALAHEIGHHLGLSHNTASNINLMFDTSPLQGFNLNKSEVNQANLL